MAAPFRFETFKGSGLAVARRQGEGNDAAVEFSHLEFTFPVKLISPRSATRDAIRRILQDASTKSYQEAVKPVAAVYVVGYGGGLVSGDTVAVDLDVGERCTMLILTQGSTKVYKMRGASSSDTTTSQTMRAIVQANATMIVLPDPVTCFSSSRYSQTQRFDLLDARTSSLVLLDWFTSGRAHLRLRDGSTTKSEQWAFRSYASRNEVRIGGKEIVARDVLLLEQSEDQARLAAEHGAEGEVARSCKPYACYATLLLIGIDTLPLVDGLKAEFYAIQQHHRKRTDGVQAVLWSCSPITESLCSNFPVGLIVRIAGIDTESVRHWLRDHLQSFKGLIGDDLYRQALG